MFGLDWKSIAAKIPTKANRASRRMNKIQNGTVWRDQPYFTSAYEKYGKNIKGIPEMACFFLQSSIHSLESLEGDVAECGTRFGKSALYMLEACSREREFFLFDSFEGLSDPVAGKDILASSIENDGKTRILQVGIDVVTRQFSKHPNVHLMKGWIPNRFDEVADRNFCLVHVDVDLYQPTLDSFKFFYDRTVSGGMMICDDYGSVHYPGARLAMDEFFADKQEKPIELPSGQSFIVKH
ncbi:MAG: TylF/MycF/NovP-related O-methyltransferase [Nitratireductor sp.]